MTINIVTDMLKNRRYIGEYRFKDIVNKDGIPRIVPQELFDRVQEVRVKNKRAAARHKAEDDYLLTTKLFCGKCGSFMCGESGAARNGSVHRYYKCNGAIRRNSKIAAMAVAHSILIAIYHMLKYNQPYCDLGADFYNKFNREKKINSYLKKLSELDVDITAVPAVS